MSSQSMSADVAGIVGEYNAVPPTFNDGDTVPAQFDVNGQLKIALGAALPAGNNNIGDVDIASIAAGDNNIGNVDVVTLPALPAGTNNIGDVDVLTLPSIPAGNNNIGDVDVLSLVPGTGGTNLGKAEDAGHTTGDTGVMMLGVRNDSDAALCDTDLDYTPVAVDSAGRLKTKYLSVVDQIDTSPGPVLDTASTNIQDNAGVFLTLVASLAAAVKKIRVADTTGKFIGVYTGPAASETLAFIINPGQDNEIEHAIPSGTRISVRHMANTDITEGELAMQFLG